MITILYIIAGLAVELLLCILIGKLLKRRFGDRQ